MRIPLDSEDKREAFRNDTLSAWKDYEATGLHATSAEVVGWLETWGSDNELPSPTCHQ